MIDTNQIVQVGQVAQEVKTQVSPWLPALGIAAAWIGRELGNFTGWVDANIERITERGGLFIVIGKFLWNPGALRTASSPGAATAKNPLEAKTS